jgi:DNA-binding transcriptional MerR regulator
MNLLPEAPSSDTNHDPLYNIGVVTRMTAISMATLRAWERRYNFPEASRTSGGHRLYSEHDIVRLRWVKSRIDEGMQTAQAIQALRHQEELGLDSQGYDSEAASGQQTATIDRSSVEVYQMRLFDALESRNLQTAETILGEALAITSPEDLILHVIGPVFNKIGEAWENGKLNVATEHMATNFLRQRLLMWMVSGPPPRVVKPIVLACAPDEWHEGSILMIGALLRRQRWPVSYLGQAVPLDELALFIQDINPSAVVIVAMTENSAEKLLDWPEQMPQAAETGQPKVCYGGRIFSLDPDWQSKMPGEYLGNTIEQGIKNLENLLQGNPI